MYSIDQVADELIKKIKSDGYDRTLNLNLQKLVHKIQLDMISTRKRSDG